MHIIPLGVALIIGGAALIAIVVRRPPPKIETSTQIIYRADVAGDQSWPRGERLYELLRGKLTPRFHGYDDDNGRAAADRSSKLRDEWGSASPLDAAYANAG